MENCKHERCEWNATFGNWRAWAVPLNTGVQSTAIKVAFCPDCGARLEPPKPEVMTLEEVAEDMRRFVGGPCMDVWIASITAHIEGEPRGLTGDDAQVLRQAAGNLDIFGWFGQAAHLRDIADRAQRHTKGGTQA